MKVPESVTFTTSAANRQDSFVSYNSDIFQRCETLLGEAGSLISFGVQYQGYLKQSGFEKLVAATLVPQNGLLRVGKAAPAWTPYCRFNVAYTDEADEKRLGLGSFWLNGVTGVAGVDVGDALLWSSDRCEVPEDVALDADFFKKSPAGYSDVVFGLFWLLGDQFSPRLADIGDARFWTLGKKGTETNAARIIRII